MAVKTFFLTGKIIFMNITVAISGKVVLQFSSKRKTFDNQLHDLYFLDSIFLIEESQFSKQSFYNFSSDKLSFSLHFIAKHLHKNIKLHF